MKRAAPVDGSVEELSDGRTVTRANAGTAPATSEVEAWALCSRLHTVVSNATKPPCQAFTSDVAVRANDRATYVFPDVSRTCEQLDADARYISAPDLVVEVISPDSKARDRGEKLDAYQNIPSVMEYLLVDSRRVWVCVFRRMAGGFWTETTYGIGEMVELRTAGVAIDVAELYAGTGRVLRT